MKQTTNHTAVLQTATPAEGYKVAPEAAALFDCMRATNELFSRIADAMRLLYGDIPVTNGAAVEDVKAQPYLEHCNAIADMLHEELKTRITDALGDMYNNLNLDSIII